MIQTANATGDAPVDLPERLDFAACETLVKTFENRRGTALRLQAGKVGFLGALGAEILLRAHHEWQTDDTDFQIVEPSEDFLKGLSLLGIPRHALIKEDAA